MEDRRSDWTIARKVAAAQLKDSYSDMSEDEYEDVLERQQAKQEKKAASKMARMEPQRLRALHANAVDSVVRGVEAMTVQMLVCG